MKRCVPTELMENCRSHPRSREWRETARQARRSAAGSVPARVDLIMSAWST